MKGQVKIQLLDKNGNIKKEIDGNNTITTAVSQILNPPFPNFFECYTQSSYKTNPLQYYTPIAGNSVGGIMLFNQDRDTSENHIMPNSDDFSKYIGSAGGSFSGTSSKIKGTLNANESEKLENGYKFVWDFGTGSTFSLKSLSLTSRDGGNSGLDFDLDNDTTTPECYKIYGGAYLNSSSDDKIGFGMTNGNLTNVNFIKISDYGDLVYISKDFKTMVLGKLENNSYILTKFTFKDTIGLNDNLRGNNTTSTDFLTNFNNWKKGYIYNITPTNSSLDSINKIFFDENYIYSCKTTYSGSNLTLNYVKININDFTIAQEKVFTISGPYSFGSTNKHYTIHNNKICLVDNNNNVVYIINPETETLEKTINFTRRRRDYNLYPCKISDDILMLLESTSSSNYAILIDINNSIVFYCKLGGNTSNTITQPGFSNFIQIGNSPIFVNKSHQSTSYSYLNVNLFTLYFASNFNLSEAIEKTENDVLKIIYTLTN